MDKKTRRIRRSCKTRAKIAELGSVRLCIHRTNSHIYAQIIDNSGGKVITSASSLDKAFRSVATTGSNIEAARIVGKSVAEKAILLGVNKVSFDRSGFAFHGRVKALAEAAREHGLQF